MPIFSVRKVEESIWTPSYERTSEPDSK